jgi:hypothetical protein
VKLDSEGADLGHDMKGHEKAKEYRNEVVA